GTLDHDENEFRMLRPDGGTVWVHTSVRVHTPVGGGRRLDGVVIDVTERHRAEDAAHSSEERFRAVVEQIADGVALLTGDGVIAYANQAAAAILGYEPEELAGQVFFG